MTPEQLRTLLVSFPWEKWSDDWKAAYGPLYRELIGAGGAAGAVEVGGAFALDAAALSAMADPYIGKLIVELQGTTKDAVTALIERTIAEGQAAEYGATPFELGSAIRDAVREQFAGYERWRADRIAKTETATVYNQGNLLAFRQNDITHVIVSDGQTEGSCDECEAVDGAVWTIEEAMAAPTEHPNCLPGGVLVSAAQDSILGTFARASRGELIVVRTAADHLLACTANHPVLTRRGWIPARELRHGDDVLGGRAHQRVMTIGPDDYEVPAPIEQVARAPRVSSGVTSRVVPASAEDFHGDGRNGDVYVERAFGPRQCRRQPHLVQPARHQALGVVDVQLLALARLCARLKFLRRALHAADRCVRCGRLRQALRHGPSAQPQLARFGERSHYPEAAQPSANLGRRGLRCHQRGDFGRGQLTADVLLNQPLVTRTLTRLASVSHRIAGRLERPDHGLRAGADGGRQLWARLSGLIPTVQVRDVRNLDFLGHVFNLQTVNGWYLADGIVTHNCSRSFGPASDEDIAGAEE